MMLMQAGYGDRWQSACFDPVSLGASIAAALGGGELLGTAATVGVGAVEGAGLGAATGALTGGNVGRDALFGGLAGGATAGVADAFSVAGGASGGAGGAAGGDAGSAFGQVASDASNAATYGPTSTFASDIGTSGVGGAADTLTSLGGATAAPNLASGVTTGATAPVGNVAPATQNIVALGQAAAPGPAAGAFTAPEAVPLSATDATTAAAQQALVPAGTNAIGVDTTGAAGGSAIANQGALGVDPAFVSSGGGALTTAPENVTALNGATGFTDTGIPASTAAGPQSVLQQIGGAANSAWHGAGSAIDSLGSIVASPTGKLVGAGVTGVGLVENLMRSRQTLPGMGQQGSIAAGAAQQGTLLSSYLTSGTLPPGVQSSINQALNSAITTIRSRHAAAGTSGSSTEQQEIAAAQQNAVTNGVNIADQLLSAGSNLTSLSAQVYQALVTENQALNTGVNQAVGNLAYVLGGGTGTFGANTKYTLQPTA